MLHKGFLKPKEEEDVSRRMKNSRLFIIAGAAISIFAVYYMMNRLHGVQSSEMYSSVTMAGIAVIAGITLVFAGFWMKFFAQRKRSQQNNN